MFNCLKALHCSRSLNVFENKHVKVDYLVDASTFCRSIGKVDAFETKTAKTTNILKIIALY